jgi:hypothetical protein
LRSFPHFLGSIYRRSDLNCRYKTFLRRFHHLWDRFTNQISTIQVWLPLEFFINPEAHCWNHFHVFHKNVEITFMYFTDGSVHKTIAEITFIYFTKTLLKSLSCISQKKKQMLKSLSCISQNHCWNHFHAFHNANLKSLSCVSENKCWNHFHVFHKTIIEITFMCFIKQMLKSLSCISQNHCWNHFHVFQKKKPMLKSLSCISQNHCWNHFHVFHNANLKSLSCVSENKCW